MLVGKGEPVTAAIVSANRDPRVFADTDRLDISRAAGPSGHLGFANGPHFCLGASLARAQTEVALTALLHRWNCSTASTIPRTTAPGRTRSAAGSS